MSSETRSKRSYLQLKVNISDTTPTGALILDALYSNNPEFFKRFGLGPKVTKANKLLWLAYLGLTQSNVSNGYVIENLDTKDDKEDKPEPAKPKKTVTVSSPPKIAELPPLPLESTTPDLPKLEINKAEKVVDEDHLDEGALMAGLI